MPSLDALTLDDEIVWHPYPANPGSQWDTVRVFRFETPTNVYGQVQYRRCYWCGQDCCFVVSRTSGCSGQTLDDNACARCARRWLPQ